MSETDDDHIVPGGEMMVVDVNSDEVESNSDEDQRTPRRTRRVGDGDTSEDDGDTETSSVQDVEDDDDDDFLPLIGGWRDFDDNVDNIDPVLGFLRNSLPNFFVLPKDGA